MKTLVFPNKFLLVFAFISINIICVAQYKADYYLSPDGLDSNSGKSYYEPWGTWQYAADHVGPGDTVYVLGGTWAIKDSGTVAAFTADGTHGAPICFLNYPGEKPVIDGASRNPYIWNTCFTMVRVDYMHIRGIEIKNFKQGQSGKQIAGAIGASDCTNITFENLKIHEIGGAGIRFFGAWRHPGKSPYTFPEHADYPGDTTRFINCDVFNCVDSIDLADDPLPGNDADGIKMDNEIGSVMILDGCRVWNCSDDGFDGSGSALYIVNNCWSYYNGHLEGDGNGYKFAYPRNEIHTPTVVVTNSIAACNRAPGWAFISGDDNQCIGFTVLNNFAYNNDRGFVDSFGYGCSVPKVKIYRNNINFASKQLFGVDKYSFKPDGIHDHNSWDSDTLVVIDESDFISLDTTQLIWDRNIEDNSLPTIDFGKLESSSDLVDAGVDVGLAYNGLAPDMGLYELEIDPNTGNQFPLIDIQTPRNGDIFTNDYMKIKVNAEDLDGSINKVEYYYDDNLYIGESIFAPYEYDWENSIIGDNINFNIRATVIDDQGAVATSERVYLTKAWPVQMQESRFIEASIAPNPNDGSFTLSLINNPLPDNFSYIITSIDGRIVHRGMLYSKESRKRIDVSHITSGIYYLRMLSDDSGWISSVFVRR